MTEETKDTGTAQKTTPMGIILLVLVLCVLVAGGIFWFSTQDAGTNADDATGLFNTDGTETGADTPALTELPDVVAEVNGVAITKETVGGTIAQLQGMYAQQGVDPTDPEAAAEIQTQALEGAINTEVLKQAAVAAGTSVDDAVVEEELASVQARFPDAETFAAELEKAGVTLDEFRADIKEQLMVNAYVESTEEFTTVPAVTEEEMRTLYDQSVAGATGEVPSFEEVQSQIEAQLTQQKQQEAVASLIEALREAATIDVKI